MVADHVPLIDVDIIRTARFALRELIAKRRKTASKSGHHHQQQHIRYVCMSSTLIIGHSMHNRALQVMHA